MSYVHVSQTVLYIFVYNTTLELGLRFGISKCLLLPAVVFVILCGSFAAFLFFYISVFFFFIQVKLV